MASVNVNEPVRVTSYRGDAKIREGVVTKVANRKADGKEYFVLDCPDEQRYHSFVTDDAVVVRLS